MSVEHTDKIDVMGIDRANETLILTILDPIPWDDEDVHLYILQNKINTYLEFIKSGEVYQAEPEAKGMRMALEVIFKYRPNEKAVQFLQDVVPLLDEIRVTFNYGPNLQTGYLDADS